MASKRIGPGAACLACGEAVDESRVFSGSVGPFCDTACRDSNDDREVWRRAILYAERVASDICIGSELQAVDVSRAFVIGYAAGIEQATTRRATVARASRVKR